MNPQRPTLPIRLLYGYAHVDAGHRDAMEKALSLLKQDGVLATWSAREIVPGQSMSREARAEMDRADIFAFLLSPNFIKSEACQEEWYYAKLLSQNTDLRFRIPVIVRRCFWKDFLGKDDVKILPDDGRPVSEFEDPNLAWAQVCEGIGRVISEIRNALAPKEDFLQKINPYNFFEQARVTIPGETTAEKSALERLGHPAGSAGTRGKLLFEANDRDGLLRQLEDRRSELLSYPEPQPNEDEFWYLYHYLPKIRELEFPVRVWERERPDFLVESDGGALGLEMTSIHSGVYRQNVAEYRKHGMTDGPYFSPPADRLVDMKSEESRKNLGRGANESGSVLGRIVVGEINHDEIRVYVNQVALGLANKVRKVVTFDFQGPITIVVGIESTYQHRNVTWSPEGMRKESMAKIFRSLTQAAMRETESHPKISRVCFIANQRVLIVPRHGVVYCGDRKRLLPVDHYLEAVYLEEAAFR